MLLCVQAGRVVEDAHARGTPPDRIHKAEMLSAGPHTHVDVHASSGTGPGRSSCMHGACLQDVALMMDNGYGGNQKRGPFFPQVSLDDRPPSYRLAAIATASIQ